MPYELQIEVVTSGYDAVDKIRDGRIYDIIFMDHMMPKMDGIETTKLIRSLRYSYPIVALTANAVKGQEEVFLASGFDDFLSKPIDTRRLNAVLKRFIRDKQKPEVLEDARRRASDDWKSQRIFGDVASNNTSPKLAELFIRDAEKAIAAIEEIQQYDEACMEVYTTNVHAMKSALANIGDTELSAFAGRLEQSGRSGDTSAILTDTPDFLRKLNSVVIKLTSVVASFDNISKDIGDLSLLQDKLTFIRLACDQYDRKTVKNSINELRDMRWPAETAELLRSMSEHLLSGDFDEVSRIAGTMLTPNP